MKNYRVNKGGPKGESVSYFIAPTREIAQKKIINLINKYTIKKVNKAEKPRSITNA